MRVRCRVSECGVREAARGCILVQDTWRGAISRVAVINATAAHPSTMVCACCVSLPQVSLVLAGTAAAIIGGNRVLFHKRWTKCMSLAFAIPLLLLSVALSALDTHAGLRKFAFAKLCQKMTASRVL